MISRNVRNTSRNVQLFTTFLQIHHLISEKRNKTTKIHNNQKFRYTLIRSRSGSSLPDGASAFLLLLDVSKIHYHVPS